MEVLMNMINVFAWIAVIVCPIAIGVKIWLQIDYQKSLDKVMDAMKGVEAVYTDGIINLLIVTVIALTYLIVK